MVYKLVETPSLSFRIYSTEKGRKIAAKRLPKSGWEVFVQWDSKEGYGLVLKREDPNAKFFKNARSYARGLKAL